MRHVGGGCHHHRSGAVIRAGLKCGFPRPLSELLPLCSPRAATRESASWRSRRRLASETCLGYKNRHTSFIRMVVDHPALMIRRVRREGMNRRESMNTLRRILMIASAAVAGTVGGALAARAANTYQHVLLISIDGMHAV